MGIEPKSDVEIPQAIDSPNGQKCVNLQIRPSGVRVGYGTHPGPGTFQILGCRSAV